ncbi:MAG: DUF2924 domain-containing protein [Gemmatimonadota bacterium]
METLQVDFEVWKELTIRRERPDHSCNDVLRDLLGLPEPAETMPSKSGRGWTSKGVFFPEGTKFRATYKGQTYYAEVKDGGLEVNGKGHHTSTSAAAKAVTGTSVNGWLFWGCQLPGASGWASVNEMHRRTRQG